MIAKLEEMRELTENWRGSMADLEDEILDRYGIVVNAIYDVQTNQITVEVLDQDISDLLSKQEGIQN